MPTESTATRYKIPDLTERTTPLDTDLFLLSDASGVAYKLPYGGIAVKDGSITTAKLANGAVTTAKLNDGAVTENKLGAGAVTEAKLGTGAVTETKIADGAVTLAKLGTDVVATVSETMTYLGIGA